MIIKKMSVLIFKPVATLVNHPKNQRFSGAPEPLAFRGPTNGWEGPNEVRRFEN